MKYPKSLKFAKNIENNNTSRYIILDLETCQKNMKMNAKLVDNFFEVVEPLYKIFEQSWILNDEIKTKLLRGWKGKEKKEIEKNVFYKFLCDIYSGINYKIRGAYGLMVNIFTLSAQLKSGFDRHLKTIKELLKNRKQLIKDFTSNFKKYIKNENNFKNFVNKNIKKLMKLKKSIKK